MKPAIVSKEPTLEEVYAKPPEFSVGVTSDGGLYLAWIRAEKSIVLSHDETALVASVLIGQGRVMRFLDDFGK